jgi:large subunit ribosomal protein L1
METMMAKEPKQAAEGGGSGEGKAKAAGGNRRVFHKPSRRFVAAQKAAPQTPVSIEEGVRLLEAMPKTKFDQTVDLVVRLGIDPKQQDQMVRGNLSLPKGIGKAKRVAAFCQGENIEKAKAAGAIEAGGDDLVKKVNDGWLDFDLAVATPDMMPKVGRLGRILGPVGKMPSPKAGTVGPDVDKMVRGYAAGKLNFRHDAGGNIHAVVGKISFAPADLIENINAFVNELRRIKPAAAKGQYIMRACLSGTMTPSVELDIK